VDEFRDNPSLVAAHVSALAARTVSDDELLAASLFARCWPGGCEDRLDPIAIEWVRRWTPSTLVAARVDCSCANGRCGLCN
jgi:hypothetical protein